MRPPQDGCTPLIAVCSPRVPYKFKLPLLQIMVHCLRTSLKMSREHIARFVNLQQRSTVCPAPM